MARTVERELSPPASPIFYNEDELHGEEDELEEVSSSNRTSLSSPPTSVDHAHHQKRKGIQQELSGSSFSGPEHYGQQRQGQTQSGNFRLPSLSLSQFSERRDNYEDDEESIAHPMEDPESNWESDDPSRKRIDDTPSTPGIRSRKSATPSSKIYPRSSRHSGSSSKLHLHPSGSRRQTTYWASRASSASYNEPPREEKKAPLVLLHITLLLLPGAEEPILRKITPTTLERGLLIEHPRGDYQLLEELIFDSLGLDEESPDAEFGLNGTEHVNAQVAAWEKSLGVRPLQGKKQWDVRVYAANGMMTKGAWNRVWPEMERIDVEVGPRGWRGKKREDLIKGFLYNNNGGRRFLADAYEEHNRWSFKIKNAFGGKGKKFWITIFTVFGLLALMSFGAYWQLTGRSWSFKQMGDIQLVNYEFENTTSAEPIVMSKNAETHQKILVEQSENQVPITTSESMEASEGGEAGSSGEAKTQDKLAPELEDDSNKTPTRVEDVVEKEDTVYEEVLPTEPIVQEPIPEPTPLKCVVDSRGELVLDESSLPVEPLQVTSDETPVVDPNEVVPASDNEESPVNENDASTPDVPEHNGEDGPEVAHVEATTTDDADGVEKETNLPLNQGINGAAAWWKNFRA